MDIRTGVLRDEADGSDSALGLCQAVVISLLILLILECVTGVHAGGHGQSQLYPFEEGSRVCAEYSE
jgi:hypothetical protein